MSVDRTEVLVSQDVTEVIVPAEVTEVIVPTGDTIVVLNTGSPTATATAAGGVTDHQALTGRSSADAHPQSAITGLVAALAALTAADAQEVTDRNAAIATAIANLVASSPATLDTLNELATALGNDPNFATTITNLIAGKQPLDSDLTAIAALVTQAFGRSLLTLTDAAALLTLIGLDAASLAETIRDVIGAALVAGTGITLGVNDAGDTITINSVATGTPPASAVTLQDVGNYYVTDTVEAALAQLGPLQDVAQLSKFTAGLVAPPNSLDRWKAGRGPLATYLLLPVNASDTKISLLDASIVVDSTLYQQLWLEDEEVLVTASSAGRTITSTAGIATNTTLTDSGNSFSVNDVGRLVAGVGVDRNTYISAYVNAGQVTLSKPTLATNAAATVYLGATHTIQRGLNGTTAVSHATLSPVYSRQRRVVAHLGDSIVEGVSSDKILAGDGWSVRAARQLGDRVGGQIGHVWPGWRGANSVSYNVHGEYQWTGMIGPTISGSNVLYDLGFGGTTIAFTGLITAGFVWTRPAGLRVQAFDVSWIDVGLTYSQWSYSLDGGATWIDNPNSGTLYSSGQGILRRTRISCDDPTDIRVRAGTGTASGSVAKNLVVPWGSPLVTYEVPVHHANLGGMSWLNMGQGGIKIRQQLNSRTVFDGTVTNGSPNVSSATATLVGADDESTIYIDGVRYQIDSITNGTDLVLKSNYAGPSKTGTARLTIFQNDGGGGANGTVAGDRLAQFTGHHGSLFPELVIIGTFINDESLAVVQWGDGDVNAYYDCLTYCVKRLLPRSDVLLIAPYEFGGTSTVLQASYRAMIEQVAAEQGCASLNLYKAFAAYGVTSYTALAAGGYMADTVHLSGKGNRWIGSHLARVLEIA